METEFSQQFEQALRNIAQQFQGAMMKEVKKAIKAEGHDFEGGYQQGYRAGKETILEHFPAWKISPKDDYVTEAVLAMCSGFGMRVLYRGQLIKEGWKYISIRSLKLLPVEEEEKSEKS